MLNILIVDDERLARVELERLLRQFPDVEIIAQASNAIEARALLKTAEIDVIFLDIQMPEVSGLEFATEIDPSVQFVFCTAFNQHAVDAFSLNAADYLVKPVNPQRLSQTIEKIRHQVKDSNPPKTANSVEASYLDNNHGLLLKFADCSRIVRLNDVERFESIGNHVAVYTSEGKAYIHSSLTKIETRLEPKAFFKASRSEIIRVDAIERIEDGIATGSLLAIMKSGRQIEVSRRQAQSLKHFFNIW